MILVSEVKESGDVEAQLWHILQEEEHQAHASHAAQERKDNQGVLYFFFIAILQK